MKIKNCCPCPYATCNGECRIGHIEDCPLEEKITIEQLIDILKKMPPKAIVCSSEEGNTYNISIEDIEYDDDYVSIG